MAGYKVYKLICRVPLKYHVKFYVETSLLAKTKNQITNICENEVIYLNFSSYFLHPSFKI